MFQRLLLLCALCLSLLLCSTALADADPTIASADADALLKSGPTSPNLNAIVKTLGQGYNVSFTSAGQSLRDAGIVDLIFKALPAEVRTKYTDFVTASDFDVIARFQGILVAADAPDLDSLDAAERLLVVASFDGALPAKALDAIEKFDNDSDKKDKKVKKTKFRQDVVLLLSITPDQQKAIAADLLASVLKKAEDEARTLDVGPDAHLLVRTQKKKDATGYAYVWSGGVIVGSIPGATIDEAALKLAAAQTIHRLHAAATSPTPTDPIPTLTFRAPIPDGGAANATLNINSEFTFDGTFKLAGKTLEGSKKFILGFGIIKSNPPAFLEKKVPAPFQPIATLLISGTNAEMISDDTLSISTRVPTKDLMTLAEALIKTLGL